MTKKNDLCKINKSQATDQIYVLLSKTFLFFGTNLNKHFVIFLDSLKRISMKRIVFIEGFKGNRAGILNFSKSS